MSPASFQFAALGLALLSVALNVWVLLRINRDTTVTLFFPCAESHNCSHTADGRDQAVGVPLGLKLPEHVRAVRHGHGGSGLKPVGEPGASQVVLSDHELLTSARASLKGDLADRHGNVAGVDRLYSADPLVPLDDVHRRVPDLEPNRVLPDQPDGIKHAERSAQHRNP